MLDLLFYVLLCGGCVAVGVCVTLLYLRRDDGGEGGERSPTAKPLGQMGNSIAHEVRNPLTVVRGYLQLSRARVNAQDRAYLETAVAELTRAELVFRDYLEYTSPSPMLPQWVDISSVVLSAENLIRSYADVQNVALLVNLSDSLIVSGDPRQLEQLVLNLLKNAIDATPAGGLVTLTSRHAGTGVLLEVQDPGIGLPHDDTSLSLLVCHGLVKNHGGKLTFEKDRERGTQAIVRLPLV